MNSFKNKFEDKLIEKRRWDNKAKNLLKQNGLEFNEFGSAAIPMTLRSPYLYYEKIIRELIHQGNKVLEIGAGIGLHTYNLIKTGADVTATDISPNSLKVLEKIIPIINPQTNLVTMVADMEKLPFENESFDVVASAGSLSYGLQKKVDNEIRRVLKPNGFFICVDSLNNNPIYRMNRYINYLKNKRSKMVLKNMPTIQRINRFICFYKEVHVKYFGSVSFLAPLLKPLIGEKNTVVFSDLVDYKFKIKSTAFKFVLVAKK